MKRLFFILLFFGALLLCSCQEEYGILDYQDREIVAECIINSEYRVELKKEQEKCTITVLEPIESKGISFEIGESAYATAGDTKIEMDKSSLKGVCAVADIFSQSEECLTGAADSGGGSVLTFQKEACMYQITIGANNLPKRVKILSESFEYDIEICTMELK